MKAVTKPFVGTTATTVGAVAGKAAHRTRGESPDPGEGRRFTKLTASEAVRGATRREKSNGRRP